MYLALTNNKQDNFKIYQLAKLQHEYTSHALSLYESEDSMDKVKTAFEKVEKALGLQHESSRANLSKSEKIEDIAIASLYDNAKQQVKITELATQSNIKFREKSMSEIIEKMLPIVESLKHDELNKDKLLEMHQNKHYLEFPIQDPATLREHQDKFFTIYYESLNESDSVYANAALDEVKCFLDEQSPKFEKTFNAMLQKDKQASVEMTL